MTPARTEICSGPSTAPRDVGGDHEGPDVAPGDLASCSSAPRRARATCSSATGGASTTRASSPTRRSRTAVRSFRPHRHSVDTPLKDKESNDFVAIQAWGVVGSEPLSARPAQGPHELLAGPPRDHRSRPATCARLYPRIGHTVLIENAGYGVELIEELKRELTGVSGRSHPGHDGRQGSCAPSRPSARPRVRQLLPPGSGLGEDEMSEPDGDRSRPTSPTSSTRARSSRTRPRRRRRCLVDVHELPAHPADASRPNRQSVQEATCPSNLTGA